VLLKVKAVARQAADDALAASLRAAITAQLTEELNRVFSEPPVKDMLARVVRDAVAEVLGSLDWGNGRPGPGFSRR
jgi:hypothetical protein